MSVSRYDPWYYEQKNKKKSTRVSSCVQNVSCGVRLIDSPAHRLDRRRDFRVAKSRNVRRVSPESAVDFAPLRFGPRRGGKPAKAKGFLSPSETSGFASLAVSR
jgi:hypothetical protein